MPATVTATRQRNIFRVRFEYQPLIGGKHTVGLAGDFNAWSPAPMRQRNGIYSITLELSPGRHAYKFVVDGRWLTDEGADEMSSAGFDEQNAVVVVGDPAEIESLRRVPLVFWSPQEAAGICVAGTFNAWDPTACPMTRRTDGAWTADLMLTLGSYEYKYVLDGRLWMADLGAGNNREDGFGGVNSVIEVTLNTPRVSLQRRDGSILTWGLPRTAPELLNPISPTRFEFLARTHLQDVEQVLVRIDGQDIPLHRYEQDTTWEYWRLVMDRPARAFRYAFVLRDGDARLFLLEGGYTDVWNEAACFIYDPETNKPFLIPGWARDAIFYQIFPDRFCNGNPALNQTFAEWYYDDMREPPTNGKLRYGQVWYHFQPDWYKWDILAHNPCDAEGRGDWAVFYGGDFAGIEQKLDYLAHLGVTALYLNPVFEARSTHKYDAADYRRVDPHFGTNEDFRRLVRLVHERGMRLILDCAFNHTGDTHMAFVDARTRGPASPFWDWYEFKQWPLPERDFDPAAYYQCWWGFGTMPDLDYDKSRPGCCENGVRDVNDAAPNWAVVEYILGLADFWLGEMDVDGFRLDVPNEVPYWFWEMFRRRVKSVKPDAFLVGEIWHGAADWVNRLYFDAVMNYAYFRDPVMRFFNMRVCSARTFDRDLKPGRLVYPVQAAQAMMNLLDSPDTHRFLESAKGDESRLRLAVLFQMTYVGAPHVFYGDETGAMGGHDPDCRRPFDWRWEGDPARAALHDWYRTLIHIRRSRPELSRGEYHTLLAEGRVLAYRRQLEAQASVVVINNEAAPREVALPLHGCWKSLLSGARHVAGEAGVTVCLEPYSGEILASEC